MSLEQLIIIIVFRLISLKLLYMILLNICECMRKLIHNSTPILLKHEKEHVFRLNLGKDIQIRAK